MTGGVPFGPQEFGEGGCLRFRQGKSAWRSLGCGCAALKMMSRGAPGAHCTGPGQKFPLAEG